MPANRFRSYLRSFFLVNKGMKFLSLFVAIVVWYGIRGAISFEAVLEDLPVRILHDEGWAVQDGADQTVDVRFRGSRGDVQNMSRDQILVTVDERGETNPGPRTVTLTPRNVKAPPGVRPIYIRPEQVGFRLDREAEKSVPAQPDFQGQLPDGFEIEQVVCVPDTVTVYAPSTQLAGLAAVRTAPVDLDGRIQSFRVRRPLVPAGAMRIEPDRVQIEVQIREHSFRQEIAAVPVHALLLPGRNAPRLTPAEVRVELQGRPELLSSLDPGAIRAYVMPQEPEIDGGERSAPVRVHVPAGIRVVRVIPETVRWKSGSP